jgi:hypothetical protein
VMSEDDAVLQVRCRWREIMCGRDRDNGYVMQLRLSAKICNLVG